MSLNKVMLIGNAGRDPEVRHLESGSVTASFTLATTERYRDRNGDYREQTEWHNIVCWRNLADVVEKYVRKGTQLYIEGKIRTRQYTDREGNVKYITEIVADSLQLLGKKADNPATYSSPAAGTAPTPAPTPTPAPAAAPARNGTFGAAQPETPQTPQNTEMEDLPEDNPCDDLPF